MKPCGGCAGLGSHQRWCPAVVGARAARLGRTADDLDDLGDTLPPDIANQAWALAEQLRVLAGAPDAPRRVPVATLIPGDRVRFNGHDWSVFISMRHQTPDSPVVIWRPREGLEELTVIRLQRELTLIPKDKVHPNG